uniref:Uncharacterized protein n=1 Tax=viral metagenome TaxID=1070528 RepID=A0A6C0ERE3_9ZZZZ
MFSLLRKGLIYKNISSDIVEHDLDIDADQWSYDEKDVYRGSIDSEYLEHKLNVYWLYDDNSKRIGLAEHEIDEPEVFKALWFRENPYAMLYQDDTWKSTETTLWSKLSNEAYQDCLENDFTTVSDLALSSGTLLMTPELLINKPDLYSCEKCGKKSLMAKNCCSQALVSILDFSQFSILFLDDNFVIYEKLTPQCDAFEQEQLEEQPELPDQKELMDEQTLQTHSQ